MAGAHQIREIRCETGRSPIMYHLTLDLVGLGFYWDMTEYSGRVESQGVIRFALKGLLWKLCGNIKIAL